MKIREIQNAVCDHYEITLDEMLSNRQSRHIVIPRHVAFWLCRELTNHSLPTIGLHFAKKHHTTVMHACNKIDARMRADGAFHDEVRGLLYSLKTPNHGLNAFTNIITHGAQ